MRLVAAFYRQVPHDDILGPMYAGRDLSGADEHVAALPDFGVVRLRAIVEPVVTDHFLMSVEHAVECVNMGVVVDASAPALPRVAFGQSVDGKAVIRILVKKQILCSPVRRHAIRPVL